MNTTGKRLISLKQAEALTKRGHGFEAFWDNYDLIIWKPDSAAVVSPRGMLRNGKWGIAARVPINSRGRYSVEDRYARIVGGGPRDPGSR